MNGQTTRLWSYLVAHPNEDLPAPVLNKAAAGSGQYVSSFTKRISECREMARQAGGDVVKSRDEWFGAARRTWYRYVPPKTTYECPACKRHSNNLICMCRMPIEKIIGVPITR